MRSEYDQEIVCCVFRDSPEQTRYWKFVYVGLYHNKKDDRECQKICRMIGSDVDISRWKRSIPYMRDKVIDPISKDLWRVKMHILKASIGAGGNCCAEVLK